MPDSVTLPKSFQWERILQATGASEPLSDNGDNIRIANINLSSPTSSSNLTVREDTAGDYTYTCTATLQVLPEDPVISDTITTVVTVRGQ